MKAVKISPAKEAKACACVWVTLMYAAELMYKAWTAESARGAEDDRWRRRRRGHIAAAEVAEAEADAARMEELQEVWAKVLAA